MAIVANKARSPDSSVDPAYCSYNRVNAGEPNGSLTPKYIYEMILDTTTNMLWRAMGVANNTWVAQTTPGGVVS